MALALVMISFIHNIKEVIMNTLQGTDANHISDIIQVMNSGIDFYQKAQENIKDPAIGALFQRMIDARRVSVERLQPYAINEQGEREEGSSFAVEARRAYTSGISERAASCQAGIKICFSRGCVKEALGGRV